MEEEAVDIPCYFLCPISMELMKDPVTVATGITYDRESIETWLFSCKSATCPVTKQSLAGTNLTPNHTLRRVIQTWCAGNAVERIPTPKPEADASQIVKILNEGKKSPESTRTCLLRLRSISGRNQSSRKHLHAAGAADFLTAVVRKRSDTISRDEALSILHRMDLSDSDLNNMLADNGDFLESLTDVLEIGNAQSREQAITLLKSLLHVADPDYLIGSKLKLYKQVTGILSNQISVQATKAALKVLLELIPWAKNRVKAVQGGAVWGVVETIVGTGDKRLCELGLAVLEQLCGCAEGRAELVRHGAGIAVVSKKILRVSAGASDRAVRILCWISRHAADRKILEEMAAVGVAAKLCLVQQVQIDWRTKERAAEILRRHGRVWKECSCIPPHLVSGYPI